MSIFVVQASRLHVASTKRYGTRFMFRLEMNVIDANAVLNRREQR
jgi:hypothetical protein